MSDKGENHNKCPQCGQGASQDGNDGSIRSDLLQIGQTLNRPSGVREDISMSECPAECLVVADANDFELRLILLHERSMQKITTLWVVRCSSLTIHTTVRRHHRRASGEE